MCGAEVRLCEHPDLVLAIQDEEAVVTREMVAIGVDFDRFRVPAPGLPPGLLLTAAFPLAAERGGGMAVPRRGLAASAAVAEPVGYVDDIAVEFATAAVVVVPLWAGAGMRVKLVEAMAARVPVVSTTLAAEGLGSVSGRHGMLAETPEALADAASALIVDRDRARSSARTAYSHASERWSIDAVTERTQALCEEAVRRRGTRANMHDLP